MRKPDAFDRSEGAISSATGGPSPVHLRQHHVLQHVPVWQQVKRLEYKSDALAPQTGPLLVRQCRGFHAVQPVGAAGGAIQAPDDVQQRRLSGTGWTGDRQPLATVQGQIDIDKGIDCRVNAELFADLAELQHPSGCAEASVVHRTSLMSGLLYPTTTS